MNWTPDLGPRVKVWRAGVDAIEAAAKTVDMPLRLDNANALPTYPQQKQQEAA
jgi:putative transposase